MHHWVSGDGIPTLSACRRAASSAALLEAGCTSAVTRVLSCFPAGPCEAKKAIAGGQPVYRCCSSVFAQRSAQICAIAAPNNALTRLCAYSSCTNRACCACCAYEYAIVAMMHASGCGDIGYHRCK